MLNRRITAFLLAAMALALCGGAVFAAGSGGAEESAAGEEWVGQVALSAAPESGAVYEADLTGEQAEKTGEDAAPAPLVPDEVGTLSFANLESRMREHNVTILALEESIQSIKAIDYEELTDDLREQINQIAGAQWGMITGVPGLGSMMAASMDSAYNALRDTFDDLKDGKIQEDNEAVIRQLENTQNQILMAGETLYVALLDLELSDRALSRQSAALDRTIQELDLRYDFGQISALTLQETKAGRTALRSGQETLRMNLTNYKNQMELMVGAEMTGNIQIQPLPQVSAAELDAMDMEKDMEKARETSYSLFAALRTLDDAKETYKETVKNLHKTESNPDFVIARHNLQAAEYTYEAAVQNFENGFRTLYLKTKDCSQILEAAKVSLASEEAAYAAAQLKYEQGTISHNKLLAAEDELSTAQEQVESAAIDLFSAYTNYRWAVENGIMN